MCDRPQCWNSRCSCMPLQVVSSALMVLGADAKHISCVHAEQHRRRKGISIGSGADQMLGPHPCHLHSAFVFEMAMSRTRPAPGVRAVTDAKPYLAPFILNDSPAVRLSNAATDARSGPILILACCTHVQSFVVSGPLHRQVLWNWRQQPGIASCPDGT